MTFFRTLLLALLFPVFSLPVAAQRGGERLAELGFEVGLAYPDIVLPRIDGGAPGSVAEHRGRPVLVLHFASW